VSDHVDATRINDAIADAMIAAGREMLTTKQYRLEIAVQPDRVDVVVRNWDDDPLAHVIHHGDEIII
jgi:hypothetical protein